MNTTPFSSIPYQRMDFDLYEKKYNTLIQQFEQADSPDLQIAAMKNIYSLMNDASTDMNIVYVRHSINTTDAFYEKEQQYIDEIRPKLENLDTLYYKALHKSPFQKELRNEFGNQLFDFTLLKIKVMSDEIIELLQEENRLINEYDKLIASASIMFEGEERNLSGFSLFMQSTDRNMRKRATETRWAWVANQRALLDSLYDKLVKTRHKIAIKLGYKNFTEVGYARMGRVDYNENDIAKFRELIYTYAVPIVNKLKERQKTRIGVDTLEYYDQSFNYKSGNPTPKGSPEWIIENGAIMYNELSPETSQFFNFMQTYELMDLVNKKGKQSGGYCTYIPNYKAPFIFSNFNGTSGDIDVLTHEAGHAFQVYCSRDFIPNEYYWPTSESAEIHSMSMEFFTWGWMHLFFNEDTDKYKFEHLSGSMIFLPYGAAVDEFQHEVYSNPEMSPEQRRATWRKIEKKYLPHRTYTGNDYLEQGGFWQLQSHIYGSPFYYIDYVLAQICAFQFWVRMQQNFNNAWTDYVKLCKLGGSKPFLELVAKAGLHSPFEESTIKNTLEQIEKWLNSQNDVAL